MSDYSGQQPPGWYYAQGDPPGTQRYWDGSQWQGAPQPVAAPPGASFGAPAGYGATAQLGAPIERFAARFVDWLIMLVPSMLVAFPLGVGLVSMDGGNDVDALALLGGIVVAALPIVYEYIFLATQGGATPGKKLLKLKVVNEDGSDIDSGVVVRRLALWFVALIPIFGDFYSLAIFVAVLIMIFVDDKRQVPWDKVAKTIVVKTA